MTPEALNNFLINKTKRQAILEERSLKLKDLETDLTISKLSTSLQGFYYFFKRYLSFIVAIVLILIGLLLFIYPDFILDDENLKEELVKDYKIAYYLEAEEKLSDGLIGLIKRGEADKAEAFLKSIDNSIEKTAEQDILNAMRIFGVLFILFSIVLWYISRLTKKLQHRNNLLKKADALSKEILKDYQNTILEEAKELELLNQLVNKQSSL